MPTALGPIPSRNTSREPRGAWRVARSSLLVAMLVMLVAGLPPTARPPTAAAAAPASEGALFGAYVRPESGWSQSDVQSAVTGLEAKLGRTLGLDHHFYPWDSAFPSWKESWDAANGRTSMISWGAIEPWKVNNGSQDDWIRARADAVKSLGTQVYLRWYPAMDTSGMPLATIDAWRRIHGIFKNRGATNAAWVWCPTAEGFTAGSAQSYYPGDAFVDWTCANGYNWAPGRTGSTWTGFADIFSAFYAWAEPLGKPLMIGETGVQESWSGRKAAWVNDALGALKTQMPAVRAFVYFHANSSFDWRMDTSTSSMSALKAMAADPLFTGASAGGTLFGAYVQPESGWSQTDVKAAVNGLESAIGRKLDIDSHYYPWSTSFPTWRESWDNDNGRIPLVSWGPVSTSQVTSGAHDALIRARADGVAALGHPVLLRWFSEMDSSTLAPQAGTPSQFIAAWRRIHGIFKNRGAGNVRWVWCPTAWGFVTGDAQMFYPGDAYVDWICSDGFNWAPGKQGASWTRFEDIFRDFHTWGTSRGKPLMVGETGTEEDTIPGRKAEWITDARDTIKGSMPGIRAFVYFDSLTDARSGGTFDWRVDTSATSLSAFRSMGTDASFRPAHDPLVG